MPIAPSAEILLAIKGMCVIFTFGIGMLDWNSEPFNVCCVGKKYDYINLLLIDNTPRYINLLSSNFRP